MKVKKRSGRLVNFNPSNIIRRIKEQSEGLNVDSDKVALKVMPQVKDEIETVELEELVIEQAATMSTEHPDYSWLAARLYVTFLRKDTPDSFSEATKRISSKTALLNTKYIEFVWDNYKQLDRMIRQERDFNHNYFVLKTKP